jgi:SH3 domain protein
MRRLAQFFLVYLALASLLLVNPSRLLAEKGYITDSCEVIIRSGPSLRHKVIGMIPSGTSVEVVEQGKEWGRVRLAQPYKDVREGWVQSREIMTRAPWEVQLKTLHQENQQLRDQLAAYQGDPNNCITRERQTADKLTTATKELSAIQQQYEELKAVSADTLLFKEEHDARLNTLNTAQQRIAQLTGENEQLRNTQRMRWFITGAGVLLSGCLLGLILGRSRKNRQRLF